MSKRITFYASALALACLIPTMTNGQEVSLKPAPNTARILPTKTAPKLQQDHPLIPVINLAQSGYKHIHQTIDDYSCIVCRQERVNGRLQDHEFMFAKVRNEKKRDGKIMVPYSVYLKFLKPSKVKGREVLYVDGRFDGELFARRGGTRFAFVTTRIKPNSAIALKENRYPITEFGVKNLVKRLLEAAQNDLNTDCTVKFLHDAKVNNRACTGIVVTHERPEKNLQYHQVKVFIDQELNIPTHYEAFDWPAEDGGAPVLLERYTYMNFKLNNGFSDADFDPDNPSYRVK